MQTGLARIAAIHHSVEQAASMLGAASALLEAEPEYYQDHAREYYPSAEQEVRAHLAEPYFTLAWQTGRKSLEAVLKSVDEWDEEREPLS